MSVILDKLELITPKEKQLIETLRCPNSLPILQLVGLWTREDAAIKTAKSRFLLSREEYQLIHALRMEIRTGAALVIREGDRFRAVSCKPLFVS